MTVTRRALLLLAILVASIGVVGCDRDSDPSPLPTVVEFRVTGTVPSATIRHSNTLDGLTMVVSSLPFVVTIQASRPTLFLSLDATSTGTGFLQVQILVNGVVFREASMSGTVPTIAVAGNFRR